MDKILTATELFEILYNREIDSSKCIQVIFKDNIDNYIYIDDNYNLHDENGSLKLNTLLFEEYTYKIRDLEEVKKEKKLSALNKAKINLEKELENVNNSIKELSDE